MKHLTDLTGRKFGRLTVTGLAATRAKSARAEWSCLCECGKRCQVVGANLKDGNVRSCGCMRSEMFSTMLKSMHARRGMRGKMRSEFYIRGNGSEPPVSKHANQPAKKWEQVEDAIEMLTRLLP